MSKSLRIAITVLEVDYEKPDSTTVYGARALFPIGPQDSAVELNDFFDVIRGHLSSYLLDRE
jgi:hypothetical protein